MNKKGFTLIELLVVLAIIAVLTSIILASLDSARTKSKNAKVLTDLGQLKLALSNYYSIYGRYPVAGVSKDAPASATNCFGASSADWIPGLTPRYIAALPQSPFFKGETSCSTDSGYGYYSNGKGYEVVLVSTFCSNITDRLPSLNLKPASGGLGMCGYWTDDIAPQR